MDIYNIEQLDQLPDDMDVDCVDLCNTLNRLPNTKTFNSCMGHGKHPFWIFFNCTDINVISRLGRAVSKNYSDGNWEIVVDSGDVHPTGIFWLRTKTILPEDQLKKSIEDLIENILYWFKDEFDDYFKSGLNAYFEKILNNIPDDKFESMLQETEQFSKTGPEVLSYLQNTNIR